MDLKKEKMSVFEFVNMVDYKLKDEEYTTDLLLYCGHEVIAMIKKKGYMSSMGACVKEGCYLRLCDWNLR